MSLFEKKSLTDKLETKKETLGAPKASLPIIGSVRTGLAGKSDAVVNRIPVEYATRSVRDVLNYLIANAAGDKMEMAASLRENLSAATAVDISINGRNANLRDGIDAYLEEKGMKTPAGEKRYMEIEIEVSTMQQGGLYRSIR